MNTETCCAQCKHHLQHEHPNMKGFVQCNNPYSYRYSMSEGNLGRFLAAAIITCSVFTVAAKNKEEIESMPSTQDKQAATQAPSFL